MAKLKVGDVVTFYNGQGDGEHNALVCRLGSQAIEGDKDSITLIYVNEQPPNATPQVEIDVPKGEPDKEGRYYAVHS